MSYLIPGGIWSSVFAVPCAIVDDHLRMCSSLALKTLLLMLRHPGMPVDTVWLAEQLHCSPTDALDAVTYWITAGILIDQPVGPDVTQDDYPLADAVPHPHPPITTGYPVIPAAAEPVNVTEKQADGQKIVTTSVRPRISRSDVSEIVKTDPSLSELLREAQGILGGPLSPVDSEILAALHTYYGLSADVVLMLLQFCVSTGKGNMHAVEKLAASWIDRGITTHERVEEEIVRLTQSSENESKLIRAFHLHGRGLSTKEREYADRWYALGLDDTLIEYACETTLNNTGKASFAYADKILTAWKAKGISTIRAAMDDQKANTGKGTQPASRNKSAQTAGSSIDINALDAFIKSQYSD